MTPLAAMDARDDAGTNLHRGRASGLTKAELIVGLRTDLEGWREAFTGMHEGRIIKAVLVPEGA